MIQIAQLLVLSALIVAASVGCVVGVRRFNCWTRLDRYFIGEVILTFAWVFPECLIATLAMLAPGRFVNHTGDPFLTVGVILGSATANLLVIGILNMVCQGKAGFEVVGVGLPLASAAVMLVVSCASFVGLKVGSGHRLNGMQGNGISTAQLIAGFVVFIIFLMGLRLLSRQKPKEPTLAFGFDSDFRSGRGTLATSIVLAGVSVIVLVYLSPFFIEITVTWFRPSEKSPNDRSVWLLGSLTILLGLLMALPDFVLAVLDLKSKGGDCPTARLLMTSAALVAFTTMARMDRAPRSDFVSRSLFETFGITIFVVAVTVNLLLAVPTRLSVRKRGMIVTALALAGLVVSVLVLQPLE